LQREGEVNIWQLPTGQPAFADRPANWHVHSLNLGTAQWFLAHVGHHGDVGRGIVLGGRTAVIRSRGKLLGYIHRTSQVPLDLLVAE